MTTYSLQLIAEAESLEEADALAESAADFLGALADHVRVEIVAVFEPPESYASEEPDPNDGYPYSMVDGRGHRECPVCERHIPPAFYADHWHFFHADIEDPEGFVAGGQVG